jgi:hypothetical protein
VTSPGYESWFLSARDPLAQRALWIRHTRLRLRGGPESAALWCTVADRENGQPPAVVKQVFADRAGRGNAGPERFQGDAVMDGRTAHWDLMITAGQPPLRPLRPAVLYRAPAPRTKLVVVVPDGRVNGTLGIDGRAIDVSGWRATAGHNWGAEHADSWVWLHAAGFPAAPEGWLELVLARIRVGRALLPWTAFGALHLGGERILLGGLGRRATASPAPGQLTATVHAPGARLTVTVTARSEETVTVSYADPRGGTRIVSHAALARAKLTLERPGTTAPPLPTDDVAYEYGTSRPVPGLDTRPLPEG